MSMQGSEMMYVIAAYSTGASRPPISSPGRSNRADLTITRSKPAALRALEPDRVLVVREAEQRHVGIGLGDLVGIDPADVGDHELGWVDTLDRDEVMLREQRLELRAKEEIDADEQDPRHAWRTLPAGTGNNHYDVLSPSFAKSLVEGDPQPPVAVEEEQQPERDQGARRRRPAAPGSATAPSGTSCIACAKATPAMHEGGAEAERVGEEQDHAARDPAARARDREDRGEHGADARRRHDGEGAAEQNAATRCVRARETSPGASARSGQRQQPDEREADHDEDEPGDRRPGSSCRPCSRSRQRRHRGSRTRS